MPLLHGMVDGDKMLILHLFNGDGMIFVRFFRFQSRQGNAAATDHGISKGMHSIAADGTDIEQTSLHVGGDVPVNDMLSVHQLNDRDSQGLSQGL